MSDLPHMHDTYKAEREGLDLDLQPIDLDPECLDDAMHHFGRERELRHREKDLCAAVQQLFLIVKGSDGVFGPALLHEAMRTLGFQPAMRYNSRDLGRALSQAWQSMQDAEEREEVLYDLLDNVSGSEDEPTEEA